MPARNNRWIAWIVREAAAPLPALPWERASRRMPAPQAVQDVAEGIHAN